MSKLKAKKLNVTEFTALLKSEYTSMTEEEWQEKDAGYFSVHNLIYHMEVGDSRHGVEFSLENLHANDEDLHPKTVDGLTHLFLSAGGDWEYPVYFVLYFNEESKLAHYVPKTGNTFLVHKNAAYGNYHEEDEKYAQSQGYADFEKYEEKAECGYNATMMYVEIKNMFEIVN